MSEDKAPSGKGGARGGSALLATALPAVLAAAAAFGGVKLAGGHRAAAAAPAQHVEAPKPPAPPGPTLALDPFVLTILDSTRKVHPMKVTVAIEFAKGAKEEELKTLVPRIRDAALGYFRTLTFDDAVDPAASDKMRPEVLARVKGAATGAERILVTDLVVQ